MTFWAKVSVGLIATMVVGVIILLSSSYRSSGVRLSAEELRRNDVQQAAKILCSYRTLCGSLPAGINAFPNASCAACRASSSCNADVMFLGRIEKPDLGYRGTTYVLTGTGAHLISEPKEAGLANIEADARCL